ncbi:MAG: hypothetical protein KGJ23_07400 [Euryarchaeota archaeon]|nr:hypothetical protein [Euryarchaeota archaeon]MDE1879060.1 hypothetical protein [Euryarchaeota archaeon]MDE2044173.1 hypothetical protein [Thermoplasmata archaeon]
MGAPFGPCSTFTTSEGEDRRTLTGVVRTPPSTIAQRWVGAEPDFVATDPAADEVGVELALLTNGRWLLMWTRTHGPIPPPMLQ